jgi:hypothetical protein
VAPCPRAWSERLEGWRDHLCYRVDWFLPYGIVAPAAESPRIPLVDEPLVALGPPALIGPSRTGRLLAFSFQAVNAGYYAWQQLGLGTMFCEAWHVSFYNGLSFGTPGFRAPVGFSGLDVMDAGGDLVLFHPGVLGPLARIDGNGHVDDEWEAAPGLDIRRQGQAVWVRGVQVADGFWEGGVIQPLRAEEGWFRVV